MEKSSIFVLLGANGAGNTTIVKLLSTLLKQDSGNVTVSGFDVVSKPNRVRQSISLAGQFVAVDTNRCRIKGEYFIVNIYVRNGITGIHRSHFFDRAFAEVFEYLVIPVFICAGQSGLVHVSLIPRWYNLL